MKTILRPLSKYIDYLFTQKTKEQIRDELFLLVLSRTTSADTNIRAVEIKKVKALLKSRRFWTAVGGVVVRQIEALLGVIVEQDRLLAITVGPVPLLIVRSARERAHAVARW